MCYFRNINALVISDQTPRDCIKIQQNMKCTIYVEVFQSFNKLNVKIKIKIT